VEVDVDVYVEVDVLVEVDVVVDVEAASRPRLTSKVEMAAIPDVPVPVPMPVPDLRVDPPFLTTRNAFLCTASGLLRAKDLV